MGGHHLSFGAQALRYFRREHEGVRRTPVGGPAAWRGAELRERDDWIVSLSPGQLAELDAARAVARERGRTLATLDRDAFPLPTLGAALAALAREIDGGRGFVLLRGLPVRTWGDDDAALVFFGLGLHLGEPGAQNPQDELLGHVTDTGEDAARPLVRLYRTAAHIDWHCDLADAVGLLCLRTARSGGASRIVSSVAVYDELVRRRPDLVDRLYEPFALDVRDEDGKGRLPFIPVPPCRFAAGQLRTFWHSDYFRSAQRHAEAPRFGAVERELVALYEEIAGDPSFVLDMQFEPGDVQLVSNHTCLHARSAYEDGPSPAEKRHLLRLWLSLAR